MKTDKGEVNIAVPRKIKHRIKILAYENNTTIKKVVEIGLEYYLNHVEKHVAKV